ncbi:MAG TPA: chalcone isomerase family protein, partial [Planctomycetota bacterium]
MLAKSSILAALIVFSQPTTARQDGPAPKPVRTVKESATDIAFPVRFAPVGGGDSQELTGTGVRTKTIFSVKVYAMGLYLDGAKAAQVLERFRETTPARLEKNADFQRALVSDALPKTLRLVMARDVDGEDMAEAFDDSLGPRIEERVKRQADPAAAGELARLRGFFTAELKKGHEVVFSAWPGGALHVRIQGKDQPVLKSPALVWALFDVYLGDDPISGRTKSAFFAGAAKVAREHVSAAGGAGALDDP